jgi:hypothetical protein
MCLQYPQEVIVPNLLADFMWHSHMQNPLKYKTNMETVLGRFLNHSDDFSDADLEKYAKRTEEIRVALVGEARPKGAKPTDANSSCGGCAVVVAACGGGCGGGG